MKLLVTGGMGFIGSNFILHFLKKSNSNQVVNVDALLDGSNTKNLDSLTSKDNYKFVKGNINDSSLMNKLIDDCDVIINFAAESHVDRSISNPLSFIQSNILGVFTILEIIRKMPKKFLQISTDEVFGTLLEESADEKFCLNPSSPYSSTKASAELLIQSYIKTFGIDAIITRCTNNYGPRQFPEKLIPKTIILALQNKKIPIYGQGTSLRDWIYVDDHCNALIAVLEKGKSGNTYNISTQSEIDNLTVVKKILSILEKSEELIEFVSSRPGEDARYSLNSTQIRHNLDWKENIDFETGIRKTIDWYMTNKDWWVNIESKYVKFIPWK